MAKAAKVARGEVDIEKMSKETKIPLYKIKWHLRIPPKDWAEARKAYLSDYEGEREEALQIWASFCATAKDISLLYSAIDESGWSAVKEMMVSKWVELWKQDLEKATNFDAVYQLAASRPTHTHNSEKSTVTNEEDRELEGLLITKLLSYFDSAEQGTLIRQLTSVVQADEVFVSKWVGLCQTPDQIKMAFDACLGGIRAIALKRIEICTDPKELKRVYNTHNVGGSCEREVIVKMAEFYRK